MLSLCSSLKYELAEFTAAMQKYENNPTKNSSLNLHVTASHHVYDGNSLSGRFRRVCDGYSNWFYPTCPQPTVADGVNAIIHQLFDQVITGAYQARQRHLVYKIQSIDAHFELVQSAERKQALTLRYLNYLHEELKGVNVSFHHLLINFNLNQVGNPVSEMEVDALRNLVTQVSSATFPFWNRMLYFRPTFGSSLEEYLPKKFPAASKEKLINGAINELRLYKALLREQNWINLEALLEQPIPLIELIKSCLADQKLDIRERKRVDKWIAALNIHLDNKEESDEKAQKVVELLKNALTEIVGVVAIHGEFSIDLGMLINQLDNYGCRFAHVEDALYLRWQRNLKKGDELICAGGVYKLGNELLSPQNREDHSLRTHLKDRYRVFKIENHDLVVKIGKNPFDLAIDSYKFRDYHFGIPAVKGAEKILHTEDGHLVVFLEYLPKSLMEHEWTSSKSELDPSDEKIAARLTSFFMCMYDWQLWPNQISCTHLYLNKDNLLTITEWMDCGRRPEISEQDYFGPDNFLAAEEFFFRIAQLNNRELNFYALHYFMAVSGYSRHRMAKFYRQAVINMLKIGKFDFLNLSLPEGCDIPAYKNRLADLLTEIKLIRAESVARVIQYFEAKENSFKEQKIYLEKKEDELKIQGYNQDKKNKLELTSFQRKSRELQREFEELEDQEEEFKEKRLKQAEKDIQNWTHFQKNQDGFIKKIKEQRNTILATQVKIKEKKEVVLFLQKHPAYADANDIQKERENYHNLLEVKKELIAAEEIFYEEIIKITVFNRLIEAYLDIPTPSIISNFLVEKVVESFKNPQGFQRETINENYYSAQRKLLIDKNNYAVKMRLQDKKAL